MDIKLVA